MTTRKKTFFDFDESFLNSLTTDKHSLVSLHHCNYHIALHPWHLNDLKKSVRDILSENISSYNKELGGILLGFKNLKLESDVGLVHDSSPFIHCNVIADFFIFKPEIGDNLSGTVIKKSKDHLSCLIYKCLTVFVPNLNHEDSWKGNNVDIGDTVHIKIMSKQTDSKLPKIKGQLV